MAFCYTTAGTLYSSRDFIHGGKCLSHCKQFATAANANGTSAYHRSGVHPMQILFLVTTAMNSIAMCICVVRMPDGKAHDVWVQVKSAGCELGQTAALA